VAAEVDDDDGLRLDGVDGLVAVDVGAWEAVERDGLAGVELVGVDGAQLEEEAVLAAHLVGPGAVELEVVEDDVGGGVGDLLEDGVGVEVADAEEGLEL